MNFTDIFIRKPVLAIVVNLLILVLGMRALSDLAVRQYPKTENAVVTVTTAYYGADAQTMAGFITQPLEQAIAQAQGIDYLSSTSSTGVSVITATLRLNYDANRALTQIQTQMAAGRLQAVIPMQGAAGNKETAPVNFVGNAVSAQTGTIELRATFTNDDLRLVPGQTVEVGITTGDIPNALVVPHDALNPGLDKTFVYVVSKDSKAVMQTVTVLHDDGTTAAIEGKLRPGDKVVVEGQLRVVDGGKVAVNKNGHHTPAPHTPVGAQ